jgi:hypothetical protein
VECFWYAVLCGLFPRHSSHSFGYAEFGVVGMVGARLQHLCLSNTATSWNACVLRVRKWKNGREEHGISGKRRSRVSWIRKGVVLSEVSVLVTIREFK